MVVLKLEMKDAIGQYRLQNNPSPQAVVSRREWNSDNLAECRAYVDLIPFMQDDGNIEKNSEREEEQTGQSDTRI